MNRAIQVSTKYGPLVVTFTGADSLHVSSIGTVVGGQPFTVNRVAYRVSAQFHKRGSCKYGDHADQAGRPCASHMTTEYRLTTPEWAYGSLKNNRRDEFERPAEVSGYSQHPDINRLDPLDNKSVSYAAVKVIREVLQEAVNRVTREQPDLSTAGEVDRLQRLLNQQSSKLASLHNEIAALEAAMQQAERELFALQRKVETPA